MKGKSAQEVLEEDGLGDEYHVKLSNNPTGRFKRSAVGKTPLLDNDVGNRQQIDMITSAFKTFTF